MKILRRQEDERKKQALFRLRPFLRSRKKILYSRCFQLIRVAVVSQDSLQDVTYDAGCKQISKTKSTWRRNCSLFIINPRTVIQSSLQQNSSTIHALFLSRLHRLLFQFDTPLPGSDSRQQPPSWLTVRDNHQVSAFQLLELSVKSSSPSLSSFRSNTGGYTLRLSSIAGSYHATDRLRKWGDFAAI